MYTTITNHIELDREQRSVRKDGQAVHLTGLEYGLTRKVHITFRLDWMLAFHKSVPDESQT